MDEHDQPVSEAEASSSQFQEPAELLERKESLRFSSLLLISANLIPLAGAIFWGWSIFDIVVLYWSENVIVGAINVLRMLFAGGGKSKGASIAEKIFTIPFFIVHYGIFCTVHGV
ncbi:MAG: DUF6498-containing protein, partial [Verrucomicrobiota bacterium]